MGANIRVVPSSLIRHVLGPFQEFARVEAAGGLVLLACTALALAWANSPWAAAYEALWHLPIGVSAGGDALSMDLHHWVNDGLMALFFFVVGLEIKREVLVGELADLRRAALPIAGAVGGMIVPALLYSIVAWGTPGASGWGVPMATDIAFALGVLALLGRRVPLGLKVFLVALAIVDDLGAVLVIALFYTAQISWMALAAGLGVALLLLGANRIGARNPLIYVLGGLVTWGAFLESGVHATIAGVLVAMTVPASERLEHALHPWVSFVVMPVFALANAGVPLADASGSALRHPVALGTAAGLILGKPLGITLAAWIAVRVGVASLPTGVTWRHVHGAGILGGIGFTTSLFVSSLAFADGALLSFAKVAVLAASSTAGVVGFLVLRAAGRAG